MDFRDYFNAQADIVDGLYRTHHAIINCQIMKYMPLEADSTSIGFGPDLVTHWLRASLSGYLDFCERAGVKPAGNIDPGAEHEQRLRKKWERL